MKMCPEKQGVPNENYQMEMATALKNNMVHFGPYLGKAKIRDETKHRRLISKGSNCLKIHLLDQD